MYKITLFIREKIKSENTKDLDGRIVYRVTQCPQQDIIIDLWKCSVNETILANQLCDGIPHCTNRRDEEPDVCQGEENLSYIGITVLVILCLSLIIAGIINSTFPRDSFQQVENEKIGDEKIKDLLQVSDLEETKMQDNFQQLSIQSRIDLLCLYSLTSIEY